MRQRMRNDASVIKILDEWRQRDHPWNELTKNGVFDVTAIYRDHMKFQQSHRLIGLQIADVCAHIGLRYFRGQKNLAAYKRLRPRIVGLKGKQLTCIQIMETAIQGESDPRNRVHDFNVEEWKARGLAASREESTA